MASSNGSAGTSAGGNAVYGLGFIGAAIYFFVEASGFWDYVLAIPKAIVWPAIAVYELFQFFYG